MNAILRILLKGNTKRCSHADVSIVICDVMADANIADLDAATEHVK
jgi:hypothetical protein